MLERLLHYGICLQWRLSESLNGWSLVLGIGKALPYPLVSRLSPLYRHHHWASHLGQASKPPCTFMAFLCLPRDWGHLRPFLGCGCLKGGERNIHLRQNMCGDRHKQRATWSDQPQNWGLPLDTNLGLWEHCLPMSSLPSDRASPEHMCCVPRQKEK